MPAALHLELCKDPTRFIDAQRAFYRGDPDYVPPLTFSDRAKVDPRKSPFFEHATMECWLVRRADEIVGRFSVSRDELHDEFHGDKVGFLGHFEATDPEVTDAIVEQAARRLQELGAETLRGPIDGSTNYRCGLLVEGDPGPPFVMMPYNHLAYGDSHVLRGGAWHTEAGYSCSGSRGGDFPCGEGGPFSWDNASRSGFRIVVSATETP